MSASVDCKIAADRFDAVAREFCAIVDAAPSLDRTDFLLRIYQVLPNLISGAIRLPKVSGDDESDESDEPSPQSRVNVDKVRFGKLYTFLQEKLGDWDGYMQVFDPIEDKEAICGTLADDITDIYNDLKEGTLLLEGYSEQPEEAIWSWRLHYYFHWGKHAIDALLALHFRLQDHLE
jgi:hypothetical protein